MSRALKQIAALAALALAAQAPVSRAIVPGQIDTFQDGSTASWGDPAANTTNIASGGPAGVGDRYIQVVSGTFGGGPRLVTFNDSQWLGNYLSAGVSEVRMDLRNFGPNPLPIRIAIREFSAGSTTPGYSSTTPFFLPADGLWHSASFLLDAANLTPLNSPQPLSTDLASVGDFRILSSNFPSLIGNTISAQIGIDNIAAVPEPGSLALLGAGMSICCMRRLRKKPSR